MSRDPALLEECRALIQTIRRFPTLDAMRAARHWPELCRRLDAVLATVRRHARPPLGAAEAAPDRVRAVHWNLEHGNAFERVAAALTEHRELAGADLLLLNEVDLGMARS